MFYAYTLVFLLLLQEVVVLFKQLKPIKVGFTTEKITFFPLAFLIMKSHLNWWVMDSI